jgi:bifunctional UDP-N-acetylglucosamine pyrophosphorylase / glucosamine-1-phosphate N-acetyltransferase
VAEAWRVEGVNQRAELAALERRYQHAQATTLMAEGVSLADPARIDIRGSLTCAQDVSIDVNCIFEGHVSLATGVQVGAHCVLRNVSVGPGTLIHPFSHLDGAIVGKAAVIGPYARLRPATELADGVHVGNFVELKATTMGANSKANHLSYLGDTAIGTDCNIGAGTITCNYDGANKLRTVIGDRVHVGSDVQLVAPVSIASDATIGAGTTVWRDVTAPDLVVNPKTQVLKSGWVRPVKGGR